MCAVLVGQGQNRRADEGARSVGVRLRPSCRGLGATLSLTAVLVTGLLGQSKVAWGEEEGPRVDRQMRVVLAAHQALVESATKLNTPAEAGRETREMQPAQARRIPTVRDAMAKVLEERGEPTTAEPVAKVEDRVIPGALSDLPARVYTPMGRSPLPIVLYFPGGGFVLGDLDSYDATPRALANRASAIVISVQPRRAPEKRFPAAADDAVAAFRFVQANAKLFGGDAHRVAVAGEGAGANLATVVAMRQKKQGGAQPVFQLLITPFLDNVLTNRSHRRMGGGDYLIDNDRLAWFWRQYIGPDWKESRHPEAVPVHASTAQLRGVAPALLITAGLDPMRDEGKRYADKLTNAGVAVEAKTYDGVTHEFFGLAPVLDKAKRAQEDAGQALRAVFYKTSVARTERPLRAGYRPASAIVPAPER